MVTTIDFFTPLVDDPHTFGRIAATNAISDIYAMGATPAFALNVVAFPKALPMELLGEILRGGAEVAEAAGVAIAGGHSIDDPEPKYGMAVTGFAHPDRIWTNTGGRPGDLLVFSKRIGTGIVATAIKREQAEPSVVEAAVDSMTTLNDRAAAQLRELCAERGHRRDRLRAGRARPRAGGRVGHAGAAADGRRCRCCRACASWPRAGWCRAAHAPTWRPPTPTRRSVEHLDEVERLIACDAQTSGGLLAAVSPADAERLGWPVVGELGGGAPGTVLVD